MKTRVPELDRLFEEIGQYRGSKTFGELMTFIKKFPNLAPYNAMLVHVQKPGSQYVASARTWHDRFERSIKVGATPLIILRPFGPVSFVFELMDTEGKPVPESALNPFQVKGDISPYLYKRLLGNMLYEGVDHVEIDQGTASAGFIQSRPKGKSLFVPGDKVSYEVVNTATIAVNRNHDLQSKTATFFHELGHLYCGHLGIYKGCGWQNRKDEGRRIKEFEAESVCWIVCERRGIQNPAAEYLSGYLEMNNEIPKISVDAVLKAAGRIETLLGDPIKKPRKELIINEIRQE